MDGVSLLDRARRAGLDVHAEGATLVVVGPRRLRHLADEVLAHKPEILAALGVMCASCECAAEVTSYWGALYCRSCASAVGEKHDRFNTWPTPTWSEADDTALLKLASDSVDANAVRLLEEWRCWTKGCINEPTRVSPNGYPYCERHPRSM